MSHERLGFMKSYASAKQVRAEMMPEGMSRLSVQPISAEQHPHLLRHLVRVVRAACLRQEQLVHHGGVSNLGSEDRGDNFAGRARMMAARSEGRPCRTSASLKVSRFS